MNPAHIGVRTAGDPMRLARTIESAIAATDRNVVLTFRSLGDQVGANLVQERLVAMLAGFFGGLALLLAGLGLFGLTSYTVARRRTEIGIRMTLGAAPSGVVALVLSRVIGLVATGTVVGTLMSLWASQFVAVLLYGLEPRDPATLISAAGILAAVAAAAASLPAWLASRMIDPAEVLRQS
jgi:ABC-type antimicrobial peptide transport system permease subunit